MATENEKSISPQSSSPQSISPQSIFTETRMRRLLAIAPSMLTTEIEKNILEVLRQEVEDKVSAEGYVEKGSVRILGHGPLQTEVIRFRGYVRVEVEFVARVCNPVRGQIVECEVKQFNQYGIMAIAGPMNIVVQMPANKPPVASPGQKIMVKIVMAQPQVNQSHINVYASLETGRPEKVEKVEKENQKDLVASSEAGDVAEIGSVRGGAQSIGDEDDEVSVGAIDDEQSEGDPTIDPDAEAEEVDDPSASDDSSDDDSSTSSSDKDSETRKKIVAEEEIEADEDEDAAGYESVSDADAAPEPEIDDLDE